MLKQVHIENYKCLRDVTVELGDFTVLIGPNDSGKSSFLEVVKAVSNIVDNQPVFQADRSIENLTWRRDTSKRIVLQVTGTADGHRFLYRLEPAFQGIWPESLEWDDNKEFRTEGQELVRRQGNGINRLPKPAGQAYLPVFIGNASHPLRTVLSSVEYQFNPRALQSAAVPRPEVKLGPSGEDLAAVLDVMQNSADRSTFDEIQESLRNAIPSLSGIVLPPAPQQQGAKRVEFILAGNGQPPFTIPGSLASNGALLLTAYFALAYSETPNLLLLEEPENGLHPSRLQMVVDILRKMSRGEIGNRKRQFILTTHNPLLLNYARPEEVRVFVRHPEKGTQVIPMTKVTDIDRLLKEFALGELWFLLGEEKLFEGQPA